MQMAENVCVCINTFIYEGELRVSSVQTRGDEKRINNNRKKDIYIYIYIYIRIRHERTG